MLDRSTLRTGGPSAAWVDRGRPTVDQPVRRPLTAEAPEPGISVTAVLVPELSGASSGAGR